VSVVSEHFAGSADPGSQAGLVQAKWTDTILDEVFRSLQENRPDLPADRLARTQNS
jgi:hypothetical protein